MALYYLGIIKTTSLAQDFQSLQVHRGSYLLPISSVYSGLGHTGDWWERVSLSRMWRDTCEPRKKKKFRPGPWYTAEWSRQDRIFTCRCNTAFPFSLHLDKPKASLYITLEELRGVFEEGFQVRIRVFLLVLIQLSKALRRKLFIIRSAKITALHGIILLYICHQHKVVKEELCSQTNCKQNLKK